MVWSAIECEGDHVWRVSGVPVHVERDANGDSATDVQLSMDVQMSMDVQLSMNGGVLKLN